MSAALKSPYPYFGGKRRVAPIVWRAFGDCPNFVEPFFGSGAVLLGRPQIGKIETINDINAHVANFWRAIQKESSAVAAFATDAINEAELHARHAWLLSGFGVHRERVMSDPDYFDAKIAGWWAWGMGAWIGSGWCTPGRTPSRQLPTLSSGGGGGGVHKLGLRIPSIGTSGRGVHSPDAGPIATWFGELRDRMKHVRVTCGDWSRIVSDAVTGASNTLGNMGMSPCGVFLDPPYDGEEDIYADSGKVAGDVRAWALENGDNSRLRIALCGYEGAEMPSTWREHGWKAHGGYGNRNGAEANENARRERVWFSPHCLPLEDVQTGLFGRGGAP